MKLAANHAVMLCALAFTAMNPPVTRSTNRLTNRLPRRVGQLQRERGAAPEPQVRGGECLSAIHHPMKIHGNIRKMGRGSFFPGSRNISNHAPAFAAAAIVKIRTHPLQWDGM